VQYNYIEVTQKIVVLQQSTQAQYNCNTSFFTTVASSLQVFCKL